MKTKYDAVVLGVATARDGSLCLESKSPVDIEEALGLHHSNIFQNTLTFSFAETREQVGHVGVEPEFENVFLCGSGAHRGGAVSGVPGHNAAMKVLETIKAEYDRQRAINVGFCR
jgi:phytoene dehydrogenase-like protein